MNATAIDAIREAILLIDWSGVDHPALTNAWACLAGALETETGESIRCSADCDRVRASSFNLATQPNTLFGMRVIVREDMPPDVIEFRDQSGKVVGRVVNSPATPEAQP